MIRFRMLLLAVAGAPLLASAQSAHQKADAADAKVASPIYHSAFADFRAADVPAASPDKLWLQANRIVVGDTGINPDQVAPSASPPQPKQAPGNHAGHAGHQMPTKGK